MKKLTKEQENILKRKGTEAPFSGSLLHNKEEGDYVCAACGNKLFGSKDKFDSGSGWPSFSDVVKKGSVKLKDDLSFGIKRKEVVCSECGGHLGHVFPDGPLDKTGLRYCINSLALDFKKTKNLSSQRTKT